MNSLQELIDARARAAPATLAVYGTDARRPLTFEGLRAQVAEVRQALTDLGIRAGDRVAVVLPNGPELAVAFSSIAATATVAPLNPAYQASEFEFFLEDLSASALVVQRGVASPSIAIAARRGIAVLELTPSLEEAGRFTLSAAQRPAPRALVGDPSVALVLHTSGTTGRPKLVPLSHGNLLASAHHIASQLALTQADRCLNVMPLFHIHGLMGATLSSLWAGAGVIATPGFDPARFFQWLERLEPTWYTAVPTIHQSVLEQAGAQAELIARRPLRLIRSSSASLAPSVMAALEERFKAPVIESYGMTEAAHQMTSNPLPPGARKPGSVGRAAGPQVVVLDAQGQPVPAGERGEVCIAGPNVMAGYVANPEANAKAFFPPRSATEASFFRTGDQGLLDSEGYLFLTGRLKELINRAGEKVSPREVDEALLEHPAVGQAVTFAVPHATLGEDVAAAVVLRAGQQSTEAELRAFVQGKLAAFKVPQQILLVEDLPRGPSGKLARIGLAETFAARLRANFVAPRNELEAKLAAIWQRTLEVERVGVTDNFFAVGGDSLRATVIANQAMALGLSPELVFRFPTIAEIVAAHLASAPPPAASSPVAPEAAAASEPSEASAWRWVVLGALVVAALALALRRLL